MKLSEVNALDLAAAVIRVNPHGWWYIAAAGEEWGYWDTRAEAEAFLRHGTEAAARAPR